MKHISCMSMEVVYSCQTRTDMVYGWESGQFLVKTCNFQKERMENPWNAHCSRLVLSSRLRIYHVLEMGPKPFSVNL